MKDIDGLLLEKIGQIEQSGSRVLLISSARDFHADPIYPTPIIEFLPNSKNNQYMNGDPAFINVSTYDKKTLEIISNQLNGWKMAITTNDILFQMVRSEITKNTKEDKFTRSMSNIQIKKRPTESSQIMVSFINFIFVHSPNISETEILPIFIFRNFRN